MISFGMLMGRSVAKHNATSLSALALVTSVFLYGSACQAQSSSEDQNDSSQGKHSAAQNLDTPNSATQEQNSTTQNSIAADSSASSSHHAPQETRGREPELPKVVQAPPIVLEHPADGAASQSSSQHKYLKLLPLPAEPPVNHLVDSKIDMGPIRQVTLLPLASTKPVRLEARFNEPISLHDALNIALQNSMPIRIAHESLNFQKYQFFNELTGFIPSLSASWGLSYTSIDPVPTTANSRLFQVSLRYPVFLGGNALYTALVQYYRLKGWRESYKATINDALLDVYNRYTALVLNNALLQIRVKSYQFSEAQLELNNALYKGGTGTQFAIMQSRAQLAADEQALLQQQMATRQASMAVSFALNLPMSINLVPVDDTVAENNLVDEKLEINDLIAATHHYRPEIKQYEDFRLAANRNIQVAASSFYPTVSFFTTYTHASSTIYPAANSDQLNGVASAQVASAQAVGTASNTALNQTASFSPTGNNVGTGGANTTASVVASSGGNPIATTQSGGLVTSGAVAPVFGSNSIGGGSSSNVNGSNTASAGVFPGLSDTVQGGLAISWSLTNLGSGYLSSVMTTKHIARQALLQANQELQLVLEQVRFAYCSKVAAREQIDSAAYAVKAASEALRLATLRLRSGTGTNLECIQAQRDYGTALIAQIQAIVGSSQAQAQLLHDTGLISLDTLIHGYDGKEPVKTR